MKPDERGFEDAIEASLLEHGGYLKSVPSNFDPVWASTRPSCSPSSVPPRPSSGRRCSASTGTTQTAPNGGSLRGWPRRSTLEGPWMCCAMASWTLGVTIRLAFFKPAHNLTPDLAGPLRGNRV